MKFVYTESMCDPAEYVPLAQAAEESGYLSYLVPESICYPEHADTRYPYTPDGERTFLDGRPFIDPLILIATMAAATKTIRFTPFVLKVPCREPVLLAKQISSLAVISNERFDFGVGLSPWPEDYVATNQPWAGRGKRLDEMLEIVNGLMSGAYFSFKGKFYDIPSIKMNPVPVRRPPILVGGHADLALRRAARFADGWMHAGGGGEDDFEDLKRMVERLKELRAEYGRGSDPFDIYALSPRAFVSGGINQLEDIGVTHIGVAFRDLYADQQQTLDEKIAALRGFADQVIR